MGEEIWKPVIGFEGLYEVSSDGKIKSLQRKVPHKSSGTITVRERILKPGVRKSGHLYVNLLKDSHPRTKRVHVIVAEAFIGPRSAGMEVCHNDGNPANNRVENLRYDTHAENIRDIIRHGTHFQSKKTTCKRGHLLTAPNLVPSIAKKGYRDCLACSRTRAYLINHPGLADTAQELSDSYFNTIMERK